MKWKSFHASLLLAIFIISGNSALSQPRGTKYMFCIGINNYLEGTTRATCQVCTDRELKNLNGCLNDVDTMTRLFQKYYG
ncbi:MAG: hypothetical protein ABI174_06400, partial [Chitinophagaceae bacterium]